MLKWELTEKCVLCGSDKFVFFRKAYSGVSIDTPDINHYLCECGLIFQSPHLNKESLDEYYSTGLYRDTLGIARERSSINRAKRVFKFVIGTHLDVGCDRGYLLRMTNGMGVEPCVKRVFPDVHFLPSLDDVKEKYDTVTCLHVLEHVLDPQDFINKLKDKTRKRLIIEVPDPSDVGKMPHIYYFTSAVIEKMCGMVLKKLVNNFYIFEPN